MKFLQEEAELSHARQLEQESRTSAWEAKQTSRRKLWEAFDGWKIDWDCCNSHANGVTVTLADGTPYDPVKQIAERLRQIYAAIGVNDLINNLIRAHEAFLKDLYEGADDRTHAAAIQAMLDMLFRIHRGEDETEIASELLAISPRPMMYWGHEAIHVIKNGGPLKCSCGTLVQTRLLSRELCSDCVKAGHGKTLGDLLFDLRCVTHGLSRTEDQPIDQCPEWPRWRIALRRDFGIENTEIELFELWRRWADVHHKFNDSNKFLNLTVADAERYLPGSDEGSVATTIETQELHAIDKVAKESDENIENAQGLASNSIPNAETDESEKMQTESAIKGVTAFDVGLQIEKDKDAARSWGRRFASDAKLTSLGNCPNDGRAQLYDIAECLDKVERIYGLTSNNRAKYYKALKQVERPPRAEDSPKS
jgi:hypothetical protein